MLLEAHGNFTAIAIWSFCAKHLLGITVESVLCIYELGGLNYCLFNEAIFIWAHSRMNKSNMAANMHGGISVIVIILKNTNEPFLCVIPQPPLGAAFRNDWPRNWGANSERSRRNPVLNASFMICSDVVGLRCLRSRTFSLSARPCCYICSSFPPDCVSRCPQWIKHETNSAWKAVITFFFFSYQPLSSVYIKVNFLLGTHPRFKKKSYFIYYICNQLYSQ